MRTVYAVSSGEYSDYSVHCLFENEADALAYVEAVKPYNWEWVNWRVEPFQLWSEVPAIRITDKFIPDDPTSWEYEEVEASANTAKQRDAT